MSERPTSHLKFNKRPSPVIPEHRPLYKIAQIILVLRLASRGGRSSLFRLHLFNWALKNESRIGPLRAAISEKRLRISAWGFDPALTVAIRFAEAEGLLAVDKNGCALTEIGEEFSKSIEHNPSLLNLEKGMLESLGKGITEAMVDAAAKDWSA